MAELTEAEIIVKINDLDTKIATITTALAGGTGAAQYTSYSLGPLSVSGNQQLEQLMATREMYQKMLDGFPKEVADRVTYDVDVHGDDSSEFLGDE